MDKKGLMYPLKGNRKSYSIDRVLFVDPGIGGTGLAFFEWIDSNANKQQTGVPVFSDVVRAPKNEGWDNQVWSICAEVRGILVGLRTETVVLEMPELWSGSAMSHASATHHAHSGEPADLIKLIYLIGGLGQVARETTGSLPVLISPAEWKGQLDKKKIHSRIARAYGEGVKYRDHEADAVGMGLAAQGRL